MDLMNLSRKVNVCVICVVLLAAIFHTSNAQDCGGFTDLTSNSASGSVHSPGYPNGYDKRSNCIWMYQAPANHSIQFTLVNVDAGRTPSGECQDHIEVRDGGEKSRLRFYDCILSAETVILSPSRWLWIRFYSDPIASNNKGFFARWSVVRSGPDAANITSPLPDCKSVSFLCSNKQCVSWAYRCDGENDCGCVGTGCDEYGCGGLGWSDGQMFACGISVGVVVFVLVFFGIGISDILMKRHQEAEYQKQVEEARRRNKSRKPRPSMDTRSSPSATPLPTTPGTLTPRSGTMLAPDFKRQPSSVSNLTVPIIP